MKVTPLIIFVLLSLVIVTVLYFLFPVGGVVLQQNPGKFNRAQFDAVVLAVRKLSLKPGEESLLRLDDISRPDSLHPLTSTQTIARGQGAGIVCARRDSSGNLAVVIETKDVGHA